VSAAVEVRVGQAAQNAALDADAAFVDLQQMHRISEVVGRIREQAVPDAGGNDAAEQAADEQIVGGVRRIAVRFDVLFHESVCQ